MADPDPIDEASALALTAKIVSAHVANNSVAPHELPELIRSVYAALGKANNPVLAVKLEPAVPIRSSVRQDAIFCLEDGKPFSMLKRHLMTDHKLTPQQYREKWGLPRDYPMVAPNYAAIRSTLAKKIGLGRISKRSGGKAPAKKVAAARVQSGSGRPRGRPRKVF